MSTWRDRSISIAGDVSGSAIVSGSHNVILLQTAERARQQGRDPGRMLRVAAVLAVPVYDPGQPDRPPSPLDLLQEWQKLAEAVRGSCAPILLTRLTPPTLPTLRRELSPRAVDQELFPHVLHFSGHAWAGGLFLEDEFGRVHRAATEEILRELSALAGHPIPLVVLNACESTAEEARSVGRALIEGGLARAVVGHPRPVLDAEAIRFAARLYADLTDGYSLGEAVERARRAVTTHEVVLLGDAELRFGPWERGEAVIDDGRPRGNLPPRRTPFFFGRGRELVELAELLARPPRVVVITGHPGIGKSTLALEAAHRNAWRFRGGVAYVEGPEMGAAAERLWIELAAGLGLNPPQERMREELLAYTRSAPTLLVLDQVDGLPPEEVERLAGFLRRLGEESAALITLRTPAAALTELPHARRYALLRGLDRISALTHVRTLARAKGISLTPNRARRIAAAAEGHPQLIELLVAEGEDRDLEALLEEIEVRKGAYEEKLTRVYEWSAARLGEEGREAWQSLLLFPANRAPDPVLRAVVGKEWVDRLRKAALLDFLPRTQALHWHATVAEYARLRWPLRGKARRARQGKVLAAWTGWLKRLDPKAPETEERLGAQEENLRSLLEEAAELPREAVRGWFWALDRALPNPDRTLRLRDFEEAVYRTWAGLAAEEAERAMGLHMWGWALSALGRREEALEATKKAVEIRRKLAQAQPQAFLPYLAASLNSLGNRLSELGRREEALEATEEAVALYRQLAQADPQTFLPDLAGSLTNLGNRLADLGRRQEALEATQEAVGIRRQLAQAHPQAFLPDLALSLNNLGEILSRLGWRQEALKAARETAQLYRKLVQEHPQAFLPSLAMSLHNLGVRLSALGQWKEALEATEEAVALYRQLAQAHPQTFLPDLAMSLNSLGNVLTELGRHKEALAAVQEAVKLYRQLAQDNPQAFLPDLALSLNNLGEMLSRLGRRQKALKAAREAAKLYRKLAQDNPQAFLPDLALSLNNLGLRLSALGQHQEALEVTKEAVEIRRQLAQNNPQAFQPDLATSLGVLGTVLMGLERPEEAAAAFREGLETLLPHAQLHPQAFGVLLSALLAGYRTARQVAGHEPEEGLVRRAEEILKQAL